MTQISYIHGIGQGAQERKQRAENIPDRAAIDFTAWTEGETRLALLADQVRIFSSYYPEDINLKQAETLLIDTLHKGLHRASLPTGMVTGMLATVVKEIRNAQQMTRPAAGALIGRNPQKGIADPLIPLEECETTEYEDPLTGWTWQETDQQCEKRNTYKRILNQHFEKSAHHLLYEFIANPNSQPTTVAVKTVNHKAAKSTIHNITSLSDSNLRLWLRNGVIRHNAEKGAGPLQPEETIKVLKENKGEGVNAVPAIVAIIGAIATAISATAALVTAFKQKAPSSTPLWNQLQGIGTPVWGPEVPDWENGGAGSGTSTEVDINKILPFALIGAGLLLD